MNETNIHICVVPTPEGEKHYVTVLPLETVFQKGLIGEAIVGVLTRPLAQGEPITPEGFARNAQFVKFLHEVIARHVPHDPGCQAEAKRLGTGWVYIIDQRTKTPGGAVPPEDSLGGVEAKNGVLVPDSYQPNPNHRILSSDGFFRLSPSLHEHLLHELHSRMGEE